MRFGTTRARSVLPNETRRPFVTRLGPDFCRKSHPPDRVGKNRRLGITFTQHGPRPVRLDQRGAKSVSSPRPRGPRRLHAFLCAAGLPRQRPRSLDRGLREPVEERGSGRFDRRSRLPGAPLPWRDEGPGARRRSFVIPPREHARPHPPRRPSRRVVRGEDAPYSGTGPRGKDRLAIPAPAEGDVVRRGASGLRIAGRAESHHGAVHVRGDRP